MDEKPSQREIDVALKVFDQWRRMLQDHNPESEGLRRDLEQAEEVAGKLRNMRRSAPTETEH